MAPGHGEVHRLLSENVGRAAAVAVYWRRTLYGRVAGRLYLAWCAAAIILPIVAGRLFDLTQSYRTAILIAGGANVLGVLVALGLPSQRTTRDELTHSTVAGAADG